ncbi:phosphotransferase [Taibaiella chishuiensis]|uniref:Phosphotransferase family enzyme n=1 Tax=Taibaiella chishuiensis TaxID=1434707 RepID=A0A2P8D7L8_9BACT|nr:phosphotransferase [Taibaiella chishuiensis]PSK93213.1 phosphotransferase family enzyme [Taibaiella chishuiensis]
MPDTTQTIPAPFLPTVQAALQACFGTTTIDAITLLSGGLSGAAVYKMTVNGVCYTLKLDTPSAQEHPALQDILEQTSAAGIAPGLYYYNPAAGITLTAFIDNRPLRTVMAPERVIETLARQLRRLHALPAPATGPELATTIAGLVNAYRQQAILKGPVMDEVLALYARILQARPWLEADQVLAHNDLNPGNMLCDGEDLWIIDWDTAFRNNRYIDLAAVANFFVYSEAQEQLLLRTYFEREPSAGEKDRFFLTRQVSRMIYGILLAQAAGRAQPKDYPHNQDMEDYTLSRFGERVQAGTISMAGYEGQLFYAKANWNEALRNMRSERFEAALSRLAVPAL